MPALLFKYKVMIFKSAKSIGISIAIWGAVCLLLLSSVYVMQQGGVEQWFAILNVIIAAMLLWMWFGTYYIIEGNELRYRSGPIHGVIAIDTIRIIITNKTQYVGLKPSLATGGCIIKYNKYDDIYLSPGQQELFVNELIRVNPAIEVEA
jgi:hypothetical protein